MRRLAVVVLALSCRRPEPAPVMTPPPPADHMAGDAVDATPATPATDAALEGPPVDATIADAPAPPNKPRPVARPDIRELAPSGSAVTLVPVRGKVTVFDFWAPWCAPCKTLDAELLAIARRHPHVAIRKLDVVDADSEAFTKHLASQGFDLPHVKVYDPAGVLVFAETPTPGSLPALVARVRQVVERHAK